MEMKHTPGPWKWQGEDYRGGWGWQLLVGCNGEGIACGSDKDGGGVYRNLQSHMPIDPKFCKTGLMADLDSAPAIHVRQADAHLIAAAPELLAFAQAYLAWVKPCIRDIGMAQLEDSARAAIAKATGEQA